MLTHSLPSGGEVITRTGTSQSGAWYASHASTSCDPDNAFYETILSSIG